MCNCHKTGPFDRRDPADAASLLKPFIHLYHGGAVCETDKLGYPTPDNRSPLDLVLHAPDGFIPLWDRDVTLRFRFREQSLLPFRDPEAVKAYIRALFAEALVGWGYAVPVRFQEVRERWDFEIVIRDQDNCNPAGCVLASAFFPDAGQHEMVLYPRMFDQSRDEQIETMAHELGHVFGLRHFFAQVSETAFPSEVFGRHDRFTIMNYGPDSTLTETDRQDLYTLYQEVWSGTLDHVNGTPVQLMRPFSHFRPPLPVPGRRDCAAQAVPV